MSLWSQTRAASQGPWKYLPCPTLAAISNYGHNFVSGSRPVLLRASPGRNGDRQAPPAPAQFAAASLGPQCWGIGARGRRGFAGFLGQWGCRKRAPALRFWLCSPESWPGPLRAVPKLRLSRRLIALLIRA